MKLITNFQVIPEIDIYKYSSGEYNNEKTKEARELYLKKLKANKNYEEVSPKKASEIQDKVKLHCENPNNISDNEWEEMFIVRVPQNMLINYSGQEIKNSKIPVVPMNFGMFLPKTKIRKNKIICVSEGVLYFQYLTFIGHPEVPKIIVQVLRRMGVNITTDGNDIEINNKKFCGFIAEDIGNNRLYCEGIVTFYYDDNIFKNLPDVYYSRSYKENKKLGEQSITGILNEYPNININEFLTQVLTECNFI